MTYNTVPLGEDKQVEIIWKPEGFLPNSQVFKIDLK